MAESVSSKILKQCRSALLGGIPIIYIKSDSDILIKSIIENTDTPLVVPVCGSSGGRQYEGRPLVEGMKAGKRLKDAKNIKFNSLPEYEMIDYPHLWVYKIAGFDDVNGRNELNAIFSKLEKYVVDHEDESHPKYEILQNSAVLLYSSDVQISPFLQTYTEFVEIDLPEEEEIRNIVLKESGAASCLTENPDYLSAISTAFLGFSTEEISKTMQRINATVSLENDKAVEKIIRDRKKQKMQGGILEQCNITGNIGGMKKFKAWLEAQDDALNNSNKLKRKTGTPPPKGVLLCGIPGCGKSEAAKFTAQVLNLPLLKMDMGSLMDKYQGESERKMRVALKTAETMSPCVLWIDEIEKGFSGSGNDGDSSSFKRMFGYMLGWMQDNQKPCFIFATANNIGGLPKEFFRSGRFDALYAVYLPTANECADIFKVSLQRAKANIAKSREKSVDEINCFSEDCFSQKLFLEVINSKFVKNGKPRIVIGSDIIKIVNVALRSLINEDYITGDMWKKALIKSAETCTVYGDGEENVDSIAISYCRMLRKGFAPTADDVLFRTEDYCMENLEEYERLKRKSTAAMEPEELAEHNFKLRKSELLQDNNKSLVHPYDIAVYKLLRERINSLAIQVERFERDQLIRR
ncbi:MAG: AAA family ATPase [Ruminococcaceae bacterium]|nr:AAA family ATPase [Oscillospiraceae bacterium]